MGKSMLLPEGWNTPMGELHGISAIENVKVLLEKALKRWVDDNLVGVSSEITLMWLQFWTKLQLVRR